MEPDDEVCLCFHVTRRKLENWIRLERPVRPAQLSECFGAGTGCGWCRPFLLRLFAVAATKNPNSSDFGPPGQADSLPAAAEYARERAAYLRAGKGKPPGGQAAPPS
jgi:bacterioferritin-associated ferredoxin